MRKTGTILRAAKAARFACGALALAAGAFAAGEAPAQGGTSAWQRACTDVGDCLVAARLVREDGPLFATVAVSFQETTGDAPRLTLATPLGIAVPPGVRLLVNDDTPLDAAVEVCLPDGCRAGRALTAEEARLLAEAQSLEVRYFAAASGELTAAQVAVTGLRRLMSEFAR